ncbi:MAG: hypothetical protein ACFFBH_13075 [Promethearchaeota archaeon]
MESCMIGKEAQELDEQSITERMKINKASLKKIFGAMLVYLVIMTLFFFVL